jgi:tetratricopeptide (TPR) repeat protein
MTTLLTSDDAPDAAWEQRVAQAWAAIDDLPPEAFVERIEHLAAELPSQHAIGFFERACAQDSTGRPDVAAPLYRAALERGLVGLRRRRATIQMASSLRNLGQPAQAMSLLAAELEAPSDELDGAVRAFLALALADLGREREALVHTLTALSQSLPRYNRSLARYASELMPTAS